MFLALAGTYAGHRTVEEAFPAFVSRVETVMRDEVREYVTAVVAEQPAPSRPAGSTVGDQKAAGS